MTLRVLSLFSGAGGGDLGVHMAGCTTVGLCEIEPHARAVLRHRWPGVPLHDDVTTLDGTAYRGRVDVALGGSPCQDLSVAGKRAGLAGARSSLFHHQVRIWLESDAPYLVWENVPGAYSSNGGADFAAVLSTLVGAAIPVPASGWRAGGVAAGRTAVAAWRTLDAQYYGVAQRRARVFVVAARSGADPAAVLALAEGLCGGAPPGGEAGEDAPAGVARSAGERGGYVPDRAYALTTRYAKGINTTLDDGAIIAAPLAPRVGASGAGVHRTGNERTEAEFLVAHTLRGEGFDASEDGTGRGTPLIVELTQKRLESLERKLARVREVEAELEALKRRAAIAFSNKDHGGDATNGLAPTLRAMSHDESHANGGGQVAVAFHPTQTPVHGEVTPRHGVTSGGMGVAFAQNQRGELRISAVAPQLTCGGGKPGEGYPAAQIGMTVRRLTPRECERLMGWPDDHTLHGIRENGTPYTLADGPRYKLCGNGMAAPVVAWIFDQLVAHHRVVTGGA